MKREINAESILDYLAAGFAGFIIKTTEAKRAEEVLFGLLDEAKRKDGGKYNCVIWDLESAPPKEKEPLAPIRNMYGLPPYSILLLHNYHWFLDKPPAIQAIQNALEKFKSEGKAIIIITPFPDVPVEIRKDFMLLELPLPEEESIRASMHHIAASVDKKDLLDEPSEPVIQAAKGLTQTEIENTLSLSVATTGKFDVKVINQQKIQTIEKSGLIEVLRTEKTFDDIRGYDQIKQVVGTMIPKPSAKGVLIVGPPGCGKTEFMKCTVGQFDKIGLLINFGLLYSKFQGEGSQNVEEIIKIIEAIGSCVVIMDKHLSM